MVRVCALSVGYRGLHMGCLNETGPRHPRQASRECELCRSDLDRQMIGTAERLSNQRRECRLG